METRKWTFIVGSPLGEVCCAVCDCMEQGENPEDGCCESLEAENQTGKDCMADKGYFAVEVKND